MMDLTSIELFDSKEKFHDADIIFFRLYFDIAL